MDLKGRLTSLLGRHQFGIRKNSSTTHAIIAVHDSLTKYADDPNIGASVFVSFDFTKAFDKINHGDLLFKLRNMQLPTGFFNLMVDYVSNRFQRVRINGSRSELKSVSSGVGPTSRIPFRSLSFWSVYIVFVSSVSHYTDGKICR